MQINGGGGYARLWGLVFLVLLLSVIIGCGEAATKPVGTTPLQPSLVETTIAGETPSPERRNVVLILLESVRARSVTPYNEDLKTTPFLSELAESSLLAERAYTPLPHTSKAMVAAECGIEPHLVRKITEAEPDGIPVRCLADLLKERGYETAFFQPGGDGFENRPQLVENFGHEELFSLRDMDTRGFERSNYFGYEDDIMLEPSREWLENHDEPFYVTYKTLTPHHDYRAPTRYGRVDFADWDRLNRYQNSVRYVDFFLKNLFRQYKELGLYENTIFVIYGDHGEGFDEHGRFQHDNVIWEEGIRVPLIVHDPKRFQDGERVEELATLADILPTVTNLLGYEAPEGEYTGYSLLDLPDDRTINVSCWYDYRCIASIDGYLKYIYHYDSKRPEGTQREELFDLAKDPMEERNLASQHPEKIEERRRELLEWKARVNAMYEGD